MACNFCNAQLFVKTGQVYSFPPCSVDPCWRASGRTGEHNRRGLCASAESVLSDVRSKEGELILAQIHVNSSLLERVSKAIKSATKAFAEVSMGMREEFNGLSRCLDAETRLLAVSDHYYLSAVRDVAKQICAARSTPNRETYINLIDRARDMLLAGASKSEVLEYLYQLLFREVDIE